MFNVFCFILTLLLLLSTTTSSTLSQLHQFSQYSTTTTAGIPLIHSPTSSSTLVNLTLASQELTLILDTGSSTTWLATNATICVAYNPATTLSNASIWSVPCNFGASVFQINVEPFDLADFNVTTQARIYYGDGGFVQGQYSTQDVELAGLSVENATVVLASVVCMDGDGVSSGVLGLGIAPPAAAAMLANNTALSKHVNAGSHLGSAVTSALSLSPTSSPPSLADPILPTLFNQENLEKELWIYSLSLSRPNTTTTSSSQSPDSFAGFLTISALPDLSSPYINISSTSPVSPLLALQKTSYLSPTPSIEYFSIKVDGVSASSKSTAGSTSTSNTMVLDAGTTLIYLSPSVTGGINGLFSPPATLTPDNATYQVNCDAIPPAVSFVIGGQSFAVNPVDLIYTSAVGGDKEAVCYSSLVAATGERQILGEAFLRNVLVVFDLGTDGVVLVGREEYQS